MIFNQSFAIDYLPKEHSIATLAFASLLSAASKAPEELQKALRFFFIIVSKGTDIEMVSKKNYSDLPLI